MIGTTDHSDVIIIKKITGLTICNFYTDIPTHETPSPEYPKWHVQWNDPLVLVQLASRWQLFSRWPYSFGISSGKHSFTSVIKTMKLLLLRKQKKRGIKKKTCFHQKMTYLGRRLHPLSIPYGMCSKMSPQCLCS